jgi:lipopolysaccharide export system permease protein
MIIARYITRQILAGTGAITFVLLGVVVLGRMLSYLGQASKGEIDPGILFVLMAYRLPEFVQQTLPFALMLGVLLALGKLYADSELTVLSACGVSRKQLLAIAAIPAGVITAIVCVLALKLTPWGLVKAETLLETQKELTEFDILVPGIFQEISRGARVTYAENRDGSELSNIFMHETEGNRVTSATTAVVSEDAAGERIILMSEGSLTEGMSGGEDFSVTSFEELGVRLPPREINIDIVLEEQAMSSLQLFTSDVLSEQAELQWRLSLIVIIPILTLLAVPMSKVSPRQGRFARLVPAIFLHLLYFGLLLYSRNLVAEGALSSAIGVWWVHLLFLGFAGWLYTDKVPRWLGG